jgi:hypothetical protein
MTTLACIGFGEGGRTFAKQSLAISGVRGAAYDIVFDEAAKRSTRIAEAQAMRVCLADDPSAAGRNAGFVLSSLTAAAAGQWPRPPPAICTPGRSSSTSQDLAFDRALTAAIAGVQNAGARR